MADNVTILSQYKKQVDDLRSSLPPKLQDKEVMPDDVLLRALLSVDLDFEYAKTLATNYVNARKDYPFMFGSTKDASLEGIFKKVLCFVPGIQTLQGYKVCYTKCSDWDPGRYSHVDMGSSMVLALEVMSLNYSLQKDGFVHIFDAEDMGWSHIKAFRPKVASAGGQLLGYYLPINIKHMIIINNNWAVDILWKMVHHLLPKRMRDKLIVCGKSVEALAQYLPQEVIEKKTYIPTASQREIQTNEILKNDHLIQSLWNQVMRVRDDESKQ